MSAMMSPTAATLRPVDPLIELQMGVVQAKGIVNRPSSFAARQVFPVLNTGTRFVMNAQRPFGNTYSIQRIDMRSVLKNPGVNAIRAPGSQIFMGTGLTLDPITGSCRERSLGLPIDLVSAQRAQGINLQAATAGALCEGLSIEEEVGFVELVSTVAEWHSSGGDVAVGWSEDAGNAVADIGDAARTVRGDTALFGWDAWWDFCFNAKLLSRMPDNSERNGIDVSQALTVLGKFGITKIVVGAAQYYTDAATPVLTDIHGDYCFVCVGDGVVNDLGQGQFQVTNQAGCVVTEQMPASVDGSQYLADGTLLEIEHLSLQRSHAMTAGRSYKHQKLNADAGIVLKNTRQ